MRNYFRKQHQRNDNYPPRGQIKNDIANGGSYILLEDGEHIATWVFIQGPDPTYAVINNGEWLDSKLYHVITG
jgi:hypothetical protein